MNQRIEKIIRLLLNQEEPMTVDQIKDIVKASNKTIRMDLKIIGDICESFNLTLMKKQGTGVQIIGDEYKKLEMKKEYCTSSVEGFEYSPLARRSYIALRILTATQTCISNELGEELFVSKATIHKDVHTLRPFFQHKKLDIVSNNSGIIVSGKERHIRDCIFDFMSQNERYTKLNELILNPDYKCNNTFIYEALDYTDNNFYDLFNNVLSTDVPLFQKLSFDRLQGLLVRIFISYMRVMDGCHVILSDKFIATLQNAPYYEQAKLILQKIGDEYGLNFDEYEIRYLQVHIQSILSDSSKGNRDAAAKMMAYQLIHGWMTKFNYPLDSDEILFESLYQHCKPALMRLEHNIPMENTLLPTIKDQFKNTFLITRDCCKEIEKTFNYTINDDEVAYLTLHLVAALDRLKRKLNVCLISENSIGVNNLLLQRINALVPYMNVTRIVNILSYRDRDMSNYDLILSTTNITIVTELPLIHISPILDANDIAKLNVLGYKYFKIINDPLLYSKENHII